MELASVAVDSIPTIEDQILDSTRIEPESSTLNNGLSSLSIETDETEEWKLKPAQLLRGGIVGESQESLRRRSGFCTEWKANQVSAYYEKQSEFLDGLQVCLGNDTE